MGKTQTKPTLHITLALDGLFDGQDTTGVDVDRSAAVFVDKVLRRVKEAFPEYDVTGRLTWTTQRTTINGGTATEEDIYDIRNAVYNEGEWYVFTS